MSSYQVNSLTQLSQESSWIKNTAVVLGASCIIALFAPAAIPLPFTPVPIGLQSHVILFLAALLGSKRGSLAVLAFLAQGAAGLPVFAGAQGGLWILAGPRGGYLLGYVLAAYVTGLLVERMKERKASRTFVAIALGNLAIYACGLPWLATYVGWQNVLIAGFIPFLIGDTLKTVALQPLFKAVRFFR